MRETPRPFVMARTLRISSGLFLSKVNKCVPFRIPLQGVTHSTLCGGLNSSKDKVAQLCVFGYLNKEIKLKNATLKMYTTSRNGYLTHPRERIHHLNISVDISCNLDFKSPHCLTLCLKRSARFHSCIALVFSSPCTHHTLLIKMFYESFNVYHLFSLCFGPIPNRLLYIHKPFCSAPFVHTTQYKFKIQFFILKFKKKNKRKN